MIKVIYHKNCFDGMAAAWVVSRALKDFGDSSERVEFIPASYNDNKLMEALMFDAQDNPSRDEHIIVDFSFPRDFMESLAAIAKDILVLDHHKTAKEACKGLPFCIFDMNESGASLAWKYYYPHEPLPLLVRYIKDRDLWLFKENRSEDLNSFIQSWPMTLESYDNMNFILETKSGFEEARI